MKLQLLRFCIALMFCGTMFQAHSLAVDVHVGSTTYRPDDGSFDISVLLDNTSSNVFNVASFSIQLAITPTGPHRVEFNSTTQPDTLTNTSYIFYGNSAAATDSLTPWNVDSSSGGTNNGFTFGDVTDDTLNVTLAANSSKLLAQIRMTPGAGSFAPQDGEQYIVSIVSAGTSFYDESLTLLSYTTTPGTLITIPEPSTYVMVAIGTGVLVACKRSRKQPKPESC